MSGSLEPGGRPTRPLAGATAPSGTLGWLISADDGDRPAVTAVGRQPGERTELGCATLSNWADKTANLLVEELELDPGDDLAVDLGSDWTTLVVLLGAWRAGVVASLGQADPANGPAVVHEQRVGSAPVDDDVVVVGGGMAGRHVGEVHGGLTFAVDVLSMPDEFAGVVDDPAHPALRLGEVTLSHGALAEAADTAAGLLDLPRRGRLASPRPVDQLDGLVTGPLAAWTAGGSVVLVADPASLADVAAGERADVVIDLGGRDAGGGVACELDDGAIRVTRC